MADMKYPATGETWGQRMRRLLVGSPDKEAVGRGGRKKADSVDKEVASASEGQGKHDNQHSDRYN